jgi:hypothetical protein
MIITKELVDSLHRIGLLCDVGLNYILSNNYIGTTRTQFIDKIKVHIESGGCPADYLPWSINTLVKHPLIKHHPDFIPTGRHRVLGTTTIFEDLQSARIALQTVKEANPSTHYLYCIEEETVDSSDPSDPQTSWRQV